MTEYDVIVIGAGPAGNHAAFKLAQSGYQVGVLEKHGCIGHKLCCTGIIGRECMDVFDIDRHCVLQEASSARLFSPSRDFIRVSRNEAQAFIVDRPMFDRILAERAGNAGAQYFINSTVEQIRITSEYAEVSTQTNNETRMFRCRSVVVASGFGSKLPARLNMGHIKNTIAGAQAVVETEGITEVEVFLSHKIAPGFFAWIVPTASNSSRIGLFSKKKPGDYLRQFLTQLAAEGKVQSTDVEIHYGGIPLKPAPKTYGQRVLVIGDAAGQVKPTTGGGIYYGMLGADYAASTIHRAFEQNDFSPKMLSQYEKLWKEKLNRELKLDYFARSLYNRLSDKRIDTIFNIVRENSIHERILASSYKSFDWHGELVLDGLKQMRPWIYLFGSYLPDYILRSVRLR